MDLNYICTIRNSSSFFGRIACTPLKTVLSRLDPGDRTNCIPVGGTDTVAKTEAISADGCLSTIWDRCVLRNNEASQIYYEFLLLDIGNHRTGFPRILLSRTHFVVEIRIFVNTKCIQASKDFLNLYSCLTKIHHCMVMVDPTLVKSPDFDQGTTAPALNFQKWSRDVPLNEQQIATVQCMVLREAQNKPIRSSGPWKLGPHVFLNLRHGKFFLSETHILPEQYQSTGAVLNCNTGTGKTAMSLALSAQPAQQYASGLRECNAALIVVPINLVTQWANEIKKFLPDAHICAITDVRKLKRQKNDFEMYDFVITTQSFLKGKSYEQVVLDAISCAGCLSRGENLKYFDTGLRRVLARKIIPECADDKVLPLECFHWSRIFVDEIHEIFLLPHSQRANLMSSLRCLSAGFVWGLTALDTSRPTQYCIATGLALFFYGQNCDFDPDVSLALCQLFSSRLFLRGTFDEFDNYEQFAHLICATSLERAAIEAQPTDQLALESCTNLTGCGATGEDVFTASTNEEIVEKMKVDAKNEMHRCNVKIQQIDQFLSAAEGDFMESLRQRQLTAREAWENKVRGLQTRLRFLETALETHDSECPVCLTNEPTTMFACGHKFCLTCATKIRAINFKCAVCRSVSNKFYQVSVEGSKESCKLAPLLKLLQKFRTQGESAIIFVQWTSAMVAACTFLKTKGIGAIRLCGNSHARSKQIQQFAKQTHDVLFLSFENSNSGLNLVTANHVVFLHALAGVASAEMEKQAMARVCRMGQTRRVTVHHLLIKDSIEEEIFRKRTRPHLIEI
jgi:hypothetical protein